MNKNVERAVGFMEVNDWIPNLEIGDIVDLMDVWDGVGERPIDSYSYFVNEDYYLTYWFEIVNETEVEIIDITLD